MQPQVAVIGTGYVGLVTAACLAKIGNHVIGHDNNPSRLEAIVRGDLPFYEPGLPELLENVRESGALEFSANLDQAISDADSIFIAVGTPASDGGSADLSMLEQAVIDVSKCCKPGAVIVLKSTVLPGTNERLTGILKEHGRADISIVSNPEFLREGSAVEDFLRPNKVVLGSVSSASVQRVAHLYRAIPGIDSLLSFTDPNSAELSKYAANAMLATRISFMNEIAEIAEACGANTNEIRKVMGADPRIGPMFLSAGVGYGGSCFPKDVQALASFSNSLGLKQKSILRAVHDINESQPQRVFAKLKEHLSQLEGKRIALWGVSFKPNTDDIREAPSIKLAALLLAGGAEVVAHDPIVKAEVIASYGIESANSPTQTLAGAHALVLLTEWPIYSAVEAIDIWELLEKPALVVDGRNSLDGPALVSQGVTYIPTGAPIQYAQ